MHTGRGEPGAVASRGLDGPSTPARRFPARGLRSARCAIAMVVGILQFELLIHGAESLKDKRRVVQSVKDRLHREHLCAVAEVGRLESRSVARLGLAVVGREGRHVGETLDAIAGKLRELRDAELGDTSRELLYGSGGQDEVAQDDDPRFRRDPALEAGLTRRGRRAAGETDQ